MADRLHLLYDGGLHLLHDGGLHLLHDGGLHLLYDGGAPALLPSSEPLVSPSEPSSEPPLSGKPCLCVPISVEKRRVASAQSSTA
jgi:hypothetical protein